MTKKEYLLLGDFNTELMFPRHRWDSIISSFHLQQLIKYPTTVTENRRTLLDHICADINCSFIEIFVVQCVLSHQVPICITLGFDKEKSSQVHHEIRIRNFIHFDLSAFIANNDFNLFENILGISNLDSTLH